MPCGYDTARSLREAVGRADELRAVGAGRVMGGGRRRLRCRGPGPCLIDGLEMLASILHPDRVPTAPSEALAVEV